MLDATPSGGLGAGHRRPGHRRVDRQLVTPSRAAVLPLDDAPRQSPAADDELGRHAEEVGVGELHAR